MDGPRGGSQPERDAARPLDVPVGPLAWGALIEEASLRGVPAAELILEACELLGVGDEDRSMAFAIPPLPGPRARAPGSSGSRGADERHRVSIHLAGSRWLRFEREASRRGVPLELLIGHAILVYAARPH